MPSGSLLTSHSLYSYWKCDLPPRTRYYATIVCYRRRPFTLPLSTVRLCVNCTPTRQGMPRCQPFCLNYPLFSPSPFISVYLFQRTSSPPQRLLVWDMAAHDKPNLFNLVRCGPNTLSSSLPSCRLSIGASG